MNRTLSEIMGDLFSSFGLKVPLDYDENRIFSIEAILKHNQVARMRRKILFTIFKYLLLF